MAFKCTLPLPVLHPSLEVPGAGARTPVVETQACSVYAHEISAAKENFHIYHAQLSIRKLSYYISLYHSRYQDAANINVYVTFGSAVSAETLCNVAFACELTVI